MKDRTAMELKLTPLIDQIYTSILLNFNYIDLVGVTMKVDRLTRRSFVKVAAGSLAGIPLIVQAQAEASTLAEDDAAAMALGYKENSTEVDKERYPNHDDSQLCSGCSLYVVESDDWGGCAIFPGKQVAADGWCAAYVAKPS